MSEQNSAEAQEASELVLLAQDDEIEKSVELAKVADAEAAENVTTDQEYVPPSIASEDVLQVAGNRPHVAKNLVIEQADLSVETPQVQDLITPYPLGQLQGDLMLSLKSETGAFTIVRSSHSMEETPGENHAHYVYQFEIKSDTSIFICRHRFNEFKQLQKQLDFKPLPKPTKWWYFGGSSEAFAQEREEALKAWLGDLLNDLIFRKRTAVLDFLQNWK